MKRAGLVACAWLLGCGGHTPAARESDEGGTAPADAGQGAPVLADPCPDASDPPPNLECTGLYIDIAAKQVSAAVRPYAPAVPLWSDGAEKSRWMYLPPGTTIDASDPSEWSFPAGTRFWKEFKVGGRRIETRLWKKLADPHPRWIRATYAWDRSESTAVRTEGMAVALDDGGTWTIPSPSQCDQCHFGRVDRILGFEQGLLGLAGASSASLAQLVAEGILVPAPTRVDLVIGDDGTGLAAPALGWIHVNCGVTCHNPNADALGGGANMNLRLDPTLLDGRSSAGFTPIVSTVDVPAVAATWSGQIRIVPGDPADSLLVQLISHRGMGMQMPPIATNFVDEADVAKVVGWVQAMTAARGDGGADAETDAPAPSGALEASLDAFPLDAASADATAPDAPVQDGSEDAASDVPAEEATASETGSDATVADAGPDAPPAEEAPAENGTPEGGSDAGPGDGASGDGESDGASAPTMLEGGSDADAGSPQGDGAGE
jgi:hypothetical protein